MSRLLSFRSEEGYISIYPTDTWGMARETLSQIAPHLFYNGLSLTDVRHEAGSYQGFGSRTSNLFRTAYKSCAVKITALFTQEQSPDWLEPDKEYWIAIDLIDAFNRPMDDVQNARGNISQTYYVNNCKIAAVDLSSGDDQPIVMTLDLLGGEVIRLPNDLM